LRARLLVALACLGAAPPTRVAVLEREPAPPVEARVERRIVRCLGTDDVVFVPGRDLVHDTRPVATATPDEVAARLSAGDATDCGAIRELDAAIGLVDSTEKRAVRFGVLRALARCTADSQDPADLLEGPTGFTNRAAAHAARLAQAAPELLDTLPTEEAAAVRREIMAPLNGFTLSVTEAYLAEYDLLIDGAPVDALEVALPWTGADVALRRRTPPEGWGPSLRIPADGGEWDVSARAGSVANRLRDGLGREAMVATYAAIHAPAEVVIAVPDGRKLEVWRWDGAELVPVCH
jgi:hypothetical protein